MFENWTMKKTDLNLDEYTQVSNWCNETYTFTIEDMGDYYQVVPVVVPEEVPEEQPEAVEDEQIVEDSGL